MDCQPTFEDATVRLRPLAPADRDGLFAAAADPLIGEQHPAKTRAHWGGSSNFEMKSLMIEHLPKTCDAVWFRIGAVNVAKETLDFDNGPAFYPFFQLTRDTWAKARHA